MSGGTITGCNATNGGGGIAVGGTGARLVFSGNAYVRENTMGKRGSDAETESNVLLGDGQNSNDIIQVGPNGLGEDALIGVYVAGDNGENPTNPYKDHGQKNKNFGRFQFTPPANDDDTRNKLKLDLLCRFINDRNGLMGAGRVYGEDRYVYWEELQSIEIRKTVDSDVAADASRDFCFTVTVYDTNGTTPVASINKAYGFGGTKMEFREGVANVTLKNGEHKLAVGLPVAADTDHPYSYKVEEKGYKPSAGSEPVAPETEYDTEITVNGKPYTDGQQGSTTAIAVGNFTEENGTVLIHRVGFTNIRKKADLTISKSVVSNNPVDKTHTIHYRVTLTGVNVSKEYDALYHPVTGAVRNGKLSFTSGAAEFDLAPTDESITIKGLPANVTFHVTQSIEDKNVEANFESSYSIQANGGSAVNGTGWNIGNDKTLAVGSNAVAFTIKPKTGKLTIEKKISDALDGDENRKFGFTVTLNRNDITGEFELKDKDGNILDQKAAFSVVGGKSQAHIEVDISTPVTIDGLPLNAGYSIVEDEQEYFISVSSVRSTGTVSSSNSETRSAKFTCMHKKGSLTIVNNVSSTLKEDLTRQYFRITMGGEKSDGKYQVDKTAIVSANGTTMVSNLPMDVEYHITMTNGVSGLTTTCTSKNKADDTHTNDTGKIDNATQQPRVVFESTRGSRDVKISNTVVSDLKADANKTFTFQLEDMPLVDTTAANPASSYTYDVYTGETKTRENQTLTVQDGKSNSITLANGQSAVIHGLPAGVRKGTSSIQYTVKQTPDSNFKTEVGVDMPTTEKTSIKLDVPTGTGAVVAAFTNTRKSGTLVIKKSVPSSATNLASDRERSFAFNVSMAVENTPNGGGFSYTVKSGSQTVRTGKLKFTGEISEGIDLINGQSVEITGLPLGASYTVSEVATTFDVNGTSHPKYNTISVREEGSIVANGANRSVTFTNRRKTGVLRIQNIVPQGALETDSSTTATNATKYYFKIVLKDGSSNVTGSFSGLSFVNGEKVIAITGAGYKDITLPVGVDYTVTAVKNEAGAPIDDSYVFDVTPASGSISGIVVEGTATAGFTSARKKGDLKISKTVESDIITDKDASQKTFSFTVTLSAVDSKSVNKTALPNASYTYQRYNGDQPVGNPQTLAFTGGDSGEISLGHNQSVIIMDLPRGARFSVNEGDDPDGNLVPVINPVNATIDQKASANTTAAEARFTNKRKTGKLKITKANIINYIKTDLFSEEYPFYIQLGKYVQQGGKNVFVPDSTLNGTSKRYSMKKISGQVDFKRDDQLNQEDKNAVGKVTVQGRASAVIEDLPQGVVCRVWEKGLNSFTVEPSYVDVIIVGGETREASFTNTRKGSGLVLKKEIVSDFADDRSATYLFRVTLTDDSIGDSNDSSARKQFGGMTFTDGVANVYLTAENGYGVTADGLPTGVGYTVEEVSFDNGKDPAKHFITTKTTQEGNETKPDTASGTIGEYQSMVTFTNTRAACKITTGDALLYYKDGEKYIPAAYVKLEDAFDALNGSLPFYTKSGNRYDEYTGSAFNVEMLMGEYPLEAPLTLDGNKSVRLTTGSARASEFPYTGTGYATVKRGFDMINLTSSMMTVEGGSLTLSNITLDGNRGEYTPECDGGIVYVMSGALAVNPGATLQKSSVTGKGGAVYVASNARMTMTGGEITDNSATEGGAVDIDGGTSRLNFSGASKVYNNLTASGEQKNIVLSADSSEVIQIVNSGLSSSAKLGVYVVDNCMQDHGLRERPFATLADGASIDSNAEILSDRRTDMEGKKASTNANDSYVNGKIVWSGSLKLRVCEYENDTTLISGAGLTLTNQAGLVVWSGTTDGNGEVIIPWKHGDETENFGGANLYANSTYTLRQTSTDIRHTKPNGSWTMSIDGDYKITFTATGDSTTLPIVLVGTDYQAPDLVYRIENYPTNEGYYVHKVWYDEDNTTLVGPADDRVKDVNVTFKLYRVSTGITYGNNVSAPPADAKLSSELIDQYFNKNGNNWSEIENPPAGNSNPDIVLNPPAGVQLLFMPLTLNGKTKWYIVLGNRSGTRNDFINNTNGVSNYANNNDFVAFSGRVMGTGDYEERYNQLTITNTNTYRNGFHRGDIIVYNDRMYVYRGNTGDTQVSAPPNLGNTLYDLGEVPSSSGNDSGVSYTTQSDVASLESTLTEQHLSMEEVRNATIKYDSGATQTVTATANGFTLNAVNGWGMTFDGLEGGYVYCAIETTVNGEDVSDPASDTALWYNPHYGKTTTGYTGTTTTHDIDVRNRIPYYVARVSTDGGETYKYFEYLKNTDSKAGAFDYAKDLTDDDVIIETLRETHDRYALTASTTFNCKSLIIRAADTLVDQNGKQLRSTLSIAEGSNVGGGLIYSKEGPLTVQYLNFDGNSRGQNPASGRAIHSGKGVTITDCAFSDFTWTDNGGAVYNHSGLVHVKGDTAAVVFTNCHSDGNGGAIYQESGDIKLENAEFGALNGNGQVLALKACSAGGDGGAVYHKGTTVNQAIGVTVNNTRFYGCSATNGGALRSSPAKTYIKEVTVKGCTATQKGGGIYMNYGSLSIDATDGKGLTITDCKVTGENGRGGGIYFTANAGTTLSNCTIDSCKATGENGMGGGIYNESIVTLDGTSITGCTATNGGGVYADKALYFTSGTIEQCVAVNGGGIYQAWDELKLSASGEQTKTALIKNCTATGNGGGVYQTKKNGASSSTLHMYSNASVTNNTAVNGGGVYIAVGTMTMYGEASIANNSASAGGSGVFVENGAALAMQGSSSVSNNTITGTGVVSGGIAVGKGGDGTSTATLTFSGNVKVQNNKLNDGTTIANVYLDVDSNSIIHSNGLGENAAIGIYVPDGTNLWDTESTPANMYRFLNDRDAMLHGVKFSSDDNIHWVDYICKITDADGHLLYMRDRDNKAVPALFDRLYSYSSDNESQSGHADTESAFGMLSHDFSSSGSPKLYTNANATVPYTGTEYCVKMLVPAYTMRIAVGVPAGKSITLTTEKKKATGDSDQDYYLRTDGAWQTAVITRGAGFDSKSMFTNHGDFTLKDITLDGGANIKADGTLNEQNPGRVSSKDGSIINVRLNGNLTIQTGATLRNAYTTHYWGGAAVALADTATGKITMEDGVIENCVCACKVQSDHTGRAEPSHGGGAISIYHAGSIEIKGGTIQNCRAPAGGGVFIWKDHTLSMTGGTIQNCQAETMGGAVYLGDNATMTFSGGTITGNKVAANGKGAGIYLGASEDDQYHGFLKLSGTPSFGGTGRGDDDAIITEVTENNVARSVGNFVDATLSGQMNGQKTYSKVRQDIFIAGYETAGSAATSLVVSGALNNAAGSIWVWAEQQEHYQMLKQFAVFENAGVKTGMNETALARTLAAFRNAQDDVTTGCGGDYLTGQEGDDINSKKCIYWTGGFDFAFRKIDGDGNALPGATFTLYMSAKDSNNNDVPAKLVGSNYVPADATDTLAAYKQSRSGASEKVDATATSGSGTATNSNAGKNADNAVTIKVTTDGGTTVNPVDVYGDGLVVFEKIPPGVYFLKETTSPTVDGKTYAAVEEMYKIDLNPKGYYTIYVAGRDASGNPVWTAPGPAPAPTTQFVMGTDGKYTYDNTSTSTNTVDIYTVMNVVEGKSSRVILRKVNADNVPLSGARFKVYRADMTEIKNADYKSDGYYESLASGVFFIGDLPYGTYYLHETYVPSGYEKLTTTNDNWFILTVNENGAGKLTSTNTIGNRIERQQTAP